MLFGNWGIALWNALFGMGLFMPLSWLQNDKSSIIVPKELETLSQKLYDNRDKGEAKCRIK